MKINLPVKFVSACWMVAIWSGSAYAIPTLQLDIGGGVYDDSPDVETTIATSSSFTLYALLTPQNENTDLDALLADTYFISAAIAPKLEQDASLGTFDFSGTFVDYQLVVNADDSLTETVSAPYDATTTVDVSGDMTYGAPPLHDPNDSGDSDPNDLSGHGIFDTYYSEFAFQFVSDNTVPTYNVQDEPGDPDTDSTGDTYYAAFTVDVSGLSYPYSVHFDLYNSTLKKTIDYEVDEFAPFSHDAQSTPVPEPATMLLFGTGLAGLATLGRRRKNRE